MAHHPQPSLLRRYLHAFGWMAIIAGVTLYGEHHGWLDGFSSAGLDSFLRSQQQRTSEEIFLVEVTDDDYREFFGGASPLNAAALRQLIENILSAEPAVLGVDIDTAAPQFRELAPLAQRKQVVWARAPQQALPSAEEAHDLALGPALGGLEPQPQLTGVPLFPRSADGYVRRYRRAWGPEARHQPSLSWAVVRASGRAVRGDDDEYLFNFRGDRYTFPIVHAREFLQPGGERRWGMLKDKIVLLGGSYAAARDQYQTALGPMAGVELIAHAVQTDLDDSGIREFSAAKAVLIDVAMGTLIFFAFHFSPSVRLAFWGSLVGTLALSIGLSWLAFRSTYYWVNFIPLVIGIVMDQLVEHADRYEEVKEELAEARQRISELEAAE